MESGKKRTTPQRLPPPRNTRELAERLGDVKARYLAGGTWTLGIFAARGNREE